MTAYAQSAANESLASLNETLYDRSRDAAKDTRDQRNDLASRMEQAFELGLKGLAADDLTGEVSPEKVREFRHSLSTVAQQYPDMTPMEWLDILNGNPPPADAEAEENLDSIMIE